MFILPKTSNKSSCPPVNTAEMPRLSAHPPLTAALAETVAYLLYIEHIALRKS